MFTHAKLIQAALEYDNGSPARAGHLLKVYGFAKTIGELEGLDADTRFILETAAIVHDVGIKTCLEKYGSDSGELQQREGPALARELLAGLGFDECVIERACFLISVHHTFAGIDSIDWQILVEADFLVNIYENSLSEKAVHSLYSNVFKTDTGKRLMRSMYEGVVADGSV